MKNWIKIVTGIFILGIIGAGLGYKYVYNKPHRDYEQATPDFSKKAAHIFDEYRENRSLAEQSYNGKVLQISGKLNKVETTDSLTIAVFALDEGIFGDEGIRCTMLPNHADRIKSLTGKNIEIKGFCAGYNDTDIIMEKCSIVKKSTN